MANEITQTIQLTIAKNGASANINTTKRIDMSGGGIVNNTQSIGTTAEALSLGDISGAPSQIALKNLDASNFVEIGGDSGLTVFKLRVNAGETLIFRATSGTIYAKADTAAVRVQIVASEA